MTVNELMQKLVELARDGRGQWKIDVKVPHPDACNYECCTTSADDLMIREEDKVIVIYD